MEEKLAEKVKEKIQHILDEDINTNNLEYLYKLIDIYKDTKEVESMNNYGAYGRDNYGAGNYNYGAYGRNNYGAYGRDNYGRRGYDTRYRGDEYIDSMYGNYGRYEEGRGAYNRGNYGAKDETLEGLECMLEATADFFNMIKEEATSPEEQKLVEKYTHKMMR